MKYQIGYFGENITNRKKLSLLGIEDDLLYCLKYTPKFPLMIDITEERFVTGKGLLETLQNTSIRGNICLEGPVKIVGENQ